MEPSTDELVFFVNSDKIVIKNPDPEASLLEYLRNELQLTGTKLGCAEGGCGACTVMVTRFKDGAPKHSAINACLVSLCSLHGAAVTTVEGIGNTTSGLHPVQDKLSKSHGSQCGFCTPGIVMSMYTLLCNNPHPEQTEIEKAFEGNLCRCTGYRPILEGFREFTKCCGKECVPGQQCVGENTISGKQCVDENHVSGKRCGTNGQVKCSRKGECSQKTKSFESTFPLDELKLHTREYDAQNLVFQSDRISWYRPTSLAQLLELKHKYPTAKLVVGNTEMAIEMKFKNMHYPVIIAITHIQELNVVEKLDYGLRFGASVTLSTLEATLEDVVHDVEERRTRIFSAILEMLRWFAGPQVRNVASIGGNIITASPISDLNPLLLSAGCTLTLDSLDGGQRQVKMDHEFFVGYRKTKLTPTEVLLSIDIPYTSENEYFQGYKQAKRKEDDIATVNAGMHVLFESQNSIVIKDIALSFGGMKWITVMASKTASHLKGRKWDDDLVPVATQSLLDEMPLPLGTPGGMEAYRCSLAISFFYKFYLAVRLQKQRQPGLYQSVVPTSHESAVASYAREPSRGVQVYEEVPEGQSKIDAVGRPMPHLSVQKQATGEATFVDDMPHFKGELYLSLVVSSEAHARILNVDSSEALSMPGVVDYICKNDVQGSNPIKGLAKNRDGEIFAEELVTCQGQVIGAILADTKTHAQRAAKAIKVDYEKLEPIITIQQAIAANSYLIGPRTVTNGDTTSAMATADHVMEGELHIGGQEHFYLETQACLAVPKEDGEMEVFASSQNPAAVQQAAAKALGVDYNRIHSRIKRLGGGFGGKETRFAILANPVVVAARKHNRPVRCMLDRDEDMIMTGGRHPFYAKYKVGFTKEGRVVALDVDMYSNCGNTFDMSYAVMDRALFNVDNAYHIPHVRATGYLCKTNLPSNTAFRGFGTPQAMLICENWIQNVAKFLNVHPNKVRELNMNKEGDVCYYNQALINCTVDLCWKEVLLQSDFSRRQREVDQFNRENRWRKRGISVIPLKYGVAFGIPEINQAAALVNVYLDGSVLLYHSGVEMGQGLHTKMVQVASRVLNIPTSKIYISETSSSHIPNTSPTAASFSSDLNGMAVLNACQTLINRLQPYITANPSGSWESWVEQAYNSRVSLSATGFHEIPEIDYNSVTNTGRKWLYYSMGACCSEVEIDCLTGDHSVLRTDIVMDVGKSLNPAIDIGQIEGAFVQGYGLYTMEDLKYSTTGYMYTRGPGAYKIPSFGNIPIQFNVTLLKGQSNPKAVYSSKAIGEPPLLLSASVFFAIKEAIESARQDAGIKEKIFQLDSPATAERIRMSCTDQFTKQLPIPQPGTYTPWHADV